MKLCLVFDTKFHFGRLFFLIPHQISDNEVVFFSFNISFGMLALSAVQRYNFENYDGSNKWNARSAQPIIIFWWKFCPSLKDWTGNANSKNEQQKKKFRIGNVILKNTIYKWQLIPHLHSYFISLKLTRFKNFFANSRLSRNVSLSRLSFTFRNVQGQ